MTESLPGGSAEIAPGVTCRKKAGIAAVTRTATPTARKSDGPPHDRPREPGPEAVVEIARRGQQLDPAHTPRAEHREERRLEGRRRDDREEWDEEAADAERADERHGHEEQQPETDRDRRTGEENRPPGRLHRPDDRQVDVLGRSELLAEAVDDEQRVVDRKPEPDELDEVRDVAHHRDLVREEEDGARASR